MVQQSVNDLKYISGAPKNLVSVLANDFVLQLSELLEDRTLVGVLIVGLSHTTSQVIVYQGFGRQPDVV